MRIRKRKPSKALVLCVRIGKKENTLNL